MQADISTQGAFRGMAPSAIRAERFVIGVDDSSLAEGDHVIALDLKELRAARSCGLDATPFHEVLQARDTEIEPAKEILAGIPPWRGYRFVEFLEWLICTRLGGTGLTNVTWRASRKGGATGLERILAARGWAASKSKRRQYLQYVGEVPTPGRPIEPASFLAELGGRPVKFSADWGVFSGGHIDPGTMLLLDAVSKGPPVERAVDVGAGYGPLAIGLIAIGAAVETAATEVDSVALALAMSNARAARVPMSGILDDDPTSAPDAPLTVCAFPTHLQRDASNRLLQGLCRRSQSGTALITVHASLENRFIGRFKAEGLTTSVINRTTHTVLSVG